MKVYNCIHCGKENTWGRSKTNKYCNNTCQAEYEYANKYVPLIESGQCNDGSKPLRRYVLERDNHTCVECGISEWNSKPITLQVDHIDGDSDNNYPINLRTLCPNCHSQTETFGNAGKGNRYKKSTKRNAYLQQYKASLAQGQSNGFTRRGSAVRNREDAPIGSLAEWLKALVLKTSEPKGSQGSNP